MIFQTEQELNLFLKSLTAIGSGSQGTCYIDKEKKKVYKLFHDFCDELYSVEHILQFKDIKTSTFIFPEDVIIVNNKLVGYITKYVPAQNLYQINPLTVSLDRLEKLITFALKDLKLISRQSISCYDMMYNIMLGLRIYVIDTSEYVFSSSSQEKIYTENLKPFNLEFMYFLIDGLFEKVIKENKELMEMYASHGKDMDILEFIKILRKYLSELVGEEVKKLNQARKYVDQEVENNQYIRELILK